MQTCTNLLPLMAATIDAGDSCDNRSCSALHLQKSAPTDACDHCEPVTFGEDEYDVPIPHLGHTMVAMLY